jgi:formylglycine-generating enzyme required for sulfatase activity
MAHFKQCAGLVELNLGRTKVTDAGLGNFNGFTELKNLVLYHADVGDASLANFQGSIGLVTLDLRETRATDAGLAHFAACKNLTTLDLGGLAVTDAGLAHLKDCRLLTTLGLSGTQITDQGLRHLEGLAELRTLHLRECPVTAAGVEKLAAALPQCRIEWDGGIYEPGRFTNSLGMEFALVPKGRAWLGGGQGKVGEREIEFADDFYLGVYEVTQGQWEQLMAANPSYFGCARDGDGKGVVKDISDEDLQRFPVDTVTFPIAQQFLTELNLREPDTGWVYRLPTEDEWEYACRGGPSVDRAESAFDYYFERPSTQLLPDQANFAHDKSLKRTSKVGSYQPNRLGLYDMHGNVMEWCDGDLTSDKGEPLRAMRGGAWYLVDNFTSASRRIPSPPSMAHNDRGLRVARVRHDVGADSIRDRDRSIQRDD